MTTRVEVIELLTCFDPHRSLWPTHLVHLDGREGNGTLPGRDRRASRPGTSG